MYTCVHISMHAHKKSDNSDSFKGTVATSGLDAELSGTWCEKAGFESYMYMYVMGVDNKCLIMSLYVLSLFREKGRGHSQE